MFYGKIKDTTLDTASHIFAINNASNRDHYVLIKVAIQQGLRSFVPSRRDRLINTALSLDNITNDCPALSALTYIN